MVLEEKNKIKLKRNIFSVKQMFKYLIICSLFYACNNSGNSNIEKVFDPELIPTMVAYNDSILYSDSGRVQVKVIAAEILMFDKSKDPYTLFPEKAYMEQYDSLMNVTTKLWADSIWNFSRKKLWKLRGNVRIIKNDGTSYEGDELFWDEPNDKVYSNKLVTIKDPMRGIIIGTHFESNQNFTQRTFYGPKGSEFYVSEKNEEQSIEK